MARRAVRVAPLGALTIRPARIADYASFVALVPELRVDDPVPDAGHWAAEIAASTLIAERDGHVVGYSYFQQVGSTGYIRHLVVSPAARGCGVGGALMAALRQGFRDSGATSWDLNVRPDNNPAIRLYERSGLRAQYRSTALSLSWDRLAALPGPQVAVVVRVVQPPEDQRFERTLRLLPGQLSSGRSLPGRVIVGLLQGADDAPVGVAVFDPDFPGASCFRVAHPSFAAALLAGVRTHALAHHLLVALFVEEDEATVKVLIAAGATVRLEALHYRGAL